MNDELDEQLTTLASVLIQQNEAYYRSESEKAEQIEAEKRRLADLRFQWDTQLVPMLEHVADNVRALLHGAIYVQVAENGHGPLTVSVSFHRKFESKTSFNLKYVFNEFDGTISVETRRVQGPGHLPLHSEKLFPVSAIDPKAIKRVMVQAVTLLRDEPA